MNSQVKNSNFLTGAVTSLRVNCTGDVGSAFANSHSVAECKCLNGRKIVGRDLKITQVPFSLVEITREDEKIKVGTCRWFYVNEYST